MDNSTAELQATEDCLEDEVDDGEVWEGVNVSEIEGDIMEKSTNSLHEHLVHLETDVCSDDSSRVVAFFLVLLSKWSSRYNISIAAVSALIRIISCVFIIVGRFSSFVAQMTTIFPTSIIGLHSCLNVNSNDFRRLVSCPKCHTLYEFEKCFVDKAKMIPKVCSFSKFPNHPHRSRRQHCVSQLLRAVVTKDGDHKFYPLKVYCYKPLIESLQTLLSKPGVLNSCEHWRERKIPKDTLCDIYDGKIWEEFQYVNGSAFLAAPHNIGLMMNVDWFTPFKHTPYSVGAVYLSVMNLPRSKRFLKENMILFGLIPGPNEPPLNINSYLEPLVEELKVLWSEGMVINMPDNPGQQVHLKAGLLCVACDIPAARKVCGFLGHMAKLGCSKCTKEFHINCETGHACFGCFDDGEDESPLRNESDHREQADLASMQTTQAARDRIESQYGSRFTALMLLEYFDCVRFHIVDPMHNLFLGTAKHIMKNVWLDDIEPIIPKRFHAMMQEKVDKCETPSSMGRIPHKIASSFSSFTADQWKTWTMVFSMYALHGVLEQEHLECWYLFVQACNILVSPMLKIHDAMEGHKLLLQFCKQFQRLYGKDKVTPNMHMHMHILNCILDYGPVYAFWLFSFERYNGILGSYRTNNRSIEVQLMRHFVQEMEIGKLHIRDENYTAHSIVQELDQTAAVVGTLNDMLAQNSNSHLEIQTASRLPACEVNRMIWHCLEPYDLVGVSKEIFLDESSIAYLIESYKVLYNQAANYQQISFYAKKHSKIKFGNNVYGSQQSKSKRSSFILAAWCGRDGKVDINTVDFRPGRVLYFFKHSFTIQQNVVPHVFAFVQWYQHHSSQHNVATTRMETWCANLFEPFGPASFLPVQRIQSQFVAGFNSMNDEDTLYVCPIPQKTFI